MNKITFLSLLVSCWLIAGCQNEWGDTEGFHYDTSLHYDESILLLDSISNCSGNIADAFFVDTLFIESVGGKKTLVFPAQIYTDKKIIRSIGIHPSGDTLIVGLIEKEKTPNYLLDCPVLVYSTVNKDLPGKYLSLGPAYTYFLKKK